jgi:hypothetical protein
MRIMVASGVHAGANCRTPRKVPGRRTGLLTFVIARMVIFEYLRHCGYRVIEALAQERLQANKIHAPRRTVTPSVVQGLVSCTFLTRKSESSGVPRRPAFEAIKNPAYGRGLRQ